MRHKSSEEKMVKEFIEKRVQMIEEDGLLDLIWIDDDGGQFHNVFYDLTEISEYLGDLCEFARDNLNILHRPIQEPIEENWQDYYDIYLVTLCLCEVCDKLHNYIRKRWPELNWNRALRSDIYQLIETNQ